MSDNNIQVVLELSVRTVVGCGQLWARQGNDPKKVDLNDLVAGTITSMIPWFEKKGWIETLMDHEAGEVFANLFGVAPQMAEPELNIDLAASHDPSELAVDEFKVSEEVDGRVKAKLSERELASSLRSTDPAEVPDVPKPAKFNLLKVNRMDIDMLSKLSPKDVLIEKVVKGIADPVYRAAVEIVYTSLSVELWGTKTAEQAILDMVAKHEEIT
jgi:hypothetical protein